MMKIKHVQFKSINVLFLLGFILLFSNCKKDNFSELQPEPLATEASFNAKEKTLAATGVISTSYYVERALPAGYVKDGSVDYTSYLQTAINNNSNLVFPAFPILINEKGLIIGSNKVITFLTGSKLLLKPTSAIYYNVLRMSSVTNVTLHNPVIVGDRYKHIGTTGEAGSGIGIRGSSYVTIYSPNVSACWGDGIYIGQINSVTNCKNITIKDAVLKSNRRTGMTVVSVDGLTLDNCYAGYSDGVQPLCGINFEVNNTSCVMKGINVTNAKTEYNSGNGIQIGLRRILGAGNRTVDLTFTNHIDTKSVKCAFKADCTSRTAASSGVLYSTIKVVNPTWKASNAIPFYFSTDQSNFKMYVSSFDIYDTSSTLLSWTSASSLLKSYSQGSGTITLTQ
ncbi:MAG: hypothetical protein JWQ25_887 [Daejeonella sp.]|nr:hypothetical protein [Daejeonella sp.]